MNSEQWEKLWREQTVPPSAVNLDRFMEQLAPEPEQWERDLDDNEKLRVKLLLFVVLSQSLGFIDGFAWKDWFFLLSQLALLAWTMANRIQRRRIFGDYGLPMRQRLERMEQLLRRRATGAGEGIAGLLCMGLLGMALWLSFVPRVLGPGAGLIFGVIYLGFMIWMCLWQRRLDRSRLEGMLAKLERAKGQLGGS
jgi:hypothetical protein